MKKSSSQKNILPAVFEEKEVRRVWDEIFEKWFFSVVDIIAILSQSKDARNYWKVLKNRLKNEGSEVVTKCNQLKMPASKMLIRSMVW